MLIATGEIARTQVLGTATVALSVAQGGAAESLAVPAKAKKAA